MKQIFHFFQPYLNNSSPEDSTQVKLDTKSIDYILSQYKETIGRFQAKTHEISKMHQEFSFTNDLLQQNKQNKKMNPMFIERKRIAIEMANILKDDLTKEMKEQLKSDIYSKQLPETKGLLYSIDFEPTPISDNPTGIKNDLKSRKEDETLKYIAISMANLDRMLYYRYLQGNEYDPFDDLLPKFHQDQNELTQTDFEQFNIEKDIETFINFSMLQSFLENELPNKEADPLYGYKIHQIKEILINEQIKKSIAFMNFWKNSEIEPSIFLQKIPFIVLDSINIIINTLQMPYFTKEDADTIFDSLFDFYGIHSSINSHIYNCFISLIITHYDLVNDKMPKTIEIVTNDLNTGGINQFDSIRFIGTLGEIEENLDFRETKHFTQGMTNQIIRKLIDLTIIDAFQNYDYEDNTQVSFIAEECLEQITKTAPKATFPYLKECYQSNKNSVTIANRRPALIAFKCILYSSNESFIEEELPDLIKMAIVIHEHLKLIIFDILEIVVDNYPEMIIHQDCSKDIYNLIKMNKESNEVILLKLYNLIQIILKHLSQPLATDINSQFEAFYNFVKYGISRNDEQITNAAIDGFIELINNSSTQLLQKLCELFKEIITEIQQSEIGFFRPTFNFTDPNKKRLYICIMPSLVDQLGDRISVKDMITLLKFVNYILADDYMIEEAVQTAIKLLPSAHQKNIGFSHFGGNLYYQLLEIHKTQDPEKMKLTSIAIATLFYYYPNDSSGYIQSIYDQFIDNLNGYIKDDTIYLVFPSIFKAISLILQIKNLKSYKVFTFIDQKKDHLIDIFHTLAWQPFRIDPEEQFDYYLQLLEAYSSLMELFQSNEWFIKSLNKRVLLFLKQLERSGFCHDDILVLSLKIIVILFGTFGQSIYSEMKQPLMKNIIEKGIQYPDQDISSISSKLFYLIR